MNEIAQKQEQALQAVEKSKELLGKKIQDLANTEVTKNGLIKEINDLECISKSKGLANSTIAEVTRSLEEWTLFNKELQTRKEVVKLLGCTTVEEDEEAGIVNEFIKTLSKTKEAMAAHAKSFDKDFPIVRQSITDQYKTITNSRGVFDFARSWPSFEDMKNALSLSEAVKEDEKSSKNQTPVVHTLQQQPAETSDI